MFEKKTKPGVVIEGIALATEVLPKVIKKIKKPVADASEIIADKIVKKIQEK